MPAVWTRAMSPMRVAKALFATDPRVKAFAARVAERPENIKNVLRAMWNRDEHGWKKEAFDRVHEMEKFLSEASRIQPRK